MTSLEFSCCALDALMFLRARLPLNLSLSCSSSLLYFNAVKQAVVFIHRAERWHHIGEPWHVSACPHHIMRACARASSYLSLGWPDVGLMY